MLAGFELVRAVTRAHFWSSATTARSRALTAAFDSALESGPSEFRRFLDDELRRVAPEAYVECIEWLVVTLSIWFPTEVYCRIPVLLPHVLRDNSCRKQTCAHGHAKRHKGRIGEARDLWSTPSCEGYLRDDNSLIKQLVRALPIDSPLDELRDNRIGAGFVACHIWPMAGAVDPWINSFVANLVWLPEPLDVLSDREGHLAQSVLRHLALTTFRGVPSCSASTVETLWSSLAPPEPGIHSQGVVRNWFRVSPAWMRARRAKVEKMNQVLNACARSMPHGPGSGHSHYDLHTSDLNARAVMPLAERVQAYSASMSTDEAI